MILAFSGTTLNACLYREAWIDTIRIHPLSVLWSAKQLQRYASIIKWLAKIKIQRVFLKNASCFYIKKYKKKMKKIHAR